MKFEKVIVIAPDHPSLPGHFPGRPIVPGVVILDEVIAALHEWHPEQRAAGMSQVKFLAPLLPGRAMRVTLEESGEGRIGFECRLDDGVLATGQLRLTSRGS